MSDNLNLEEVKKAARAYWEALLEYDRAKHELGHEHPAVGDAAQVALERKDDLDEVLNPARLLGIIEALERKQ